MWRATAGSGLSTACAAGPRIQRLFTNGAAVNADRRTASPVQERARAAGASEAIITPSGTQGAVLQYASRGAANWAGRSLQRRREGRPARRAVRAKFMAASRPALELGRAAVKTDRTAVGGIPDVARVGGANLHMPPGSHSGHRFRPGARALQYAAYGVGMRSDIWARVLLLFPRADARALPFAWARRSQGAVRRTQRAVGVGRVKPGLKVTGAAKLGALQTIGERHKGGSVDSEVDEER